MKRSIILCAFAAGLHGPAHAQDSFADAFWQYKASTGFDFSSGTYGATKNTEILYLPATLQASKGPWTLKAVVPWLRVSGPALLLDGAAEGNTAVRTSGHASGLGDIGLSVMYSLESLYNDQLYVDVTAKVKAPTASFAKGLGTGAWDGAFQVDVAKAFGKFMPFGTLGYRINGQPKGFALRDVIYGTAGVQYGWSDRLATGVFYDVRRAAIKSADAPQEGTAYINYRFSDDWSVNVYGVAGFSSNSPAGGGGVVFSYKWR
jgi:hypothetical protein